MGASGQHRGGGGPPAERRERTRAPARLHRLPRYDIVIRPWNGPEPSPYAVIKAALLVDPELISLREPEPEPAPGENLVYHGVRQESIQRWLDLHDVAPAVALELLSESFAAFEWTTTR